MTESIIPRDVVVSPLVTLVGTLGRLELETVAACIVLFHQEVSPGAWIPITRRQIADWLPTSKAVARVINNPFWRLDISGFVNGEWIAGWEKSGKEHADDLGVLTPKFFATLKRGAQ